jgi:hypothetical protein
MNSRSLNATGNSRGNATVPDARFTRVDVYQAVTSALMVVLGTVILARTLGPGMHLTALLVGLGFVGLGAYRLSFVLAYLRRGRSM